MGNFLNRPFIHRMYKPRNGLNVDVGEHSCGEQGLNKKGNKILSTDLSKENGIFFADV